ncbi:MAG TPA: hypothetical protein VD789_10475, partial [Thermomicrobiales bacterium]|nr:hypothetical protein [Thermomicrobiales bacterium]
MAEPHSDRRGRFWAIAALHYVWIAALLTTLNVPTAFLFAGIATGAVCALLVRNPTALPGPAQRVAMGLLGVQAGSMVDRGVVHTVMT